jgi:hypothetical protein
MKIGTKSILFGAHQFLIHPWFVAAAWWKLYGFPWDLRLWVAFFTHDLGYLGMPNMDGPEGEMHIYLGARLMGWLFDYQQPLASRMAKLIGPVCDKFFGAHQDARSWYCFSFYHSRFIAARYSTHVSKLCYADKLSFVLTPRWFYLLTAQLTGEHREYIKLADTRYRHMHLSTTDLKTWHATVKTYLTRWVEEHKHGEPDDTPHGGE